MIDVNQNSNDSNLLFQKSLELFPDLVFLISSDGIYVDYKGNNVTLHIPPEEFLGRKIEDIMPKEIAELQMSAIKKTITTQQTQYLEFTLPLREKTIFYDYRLVYLNNNRIAAYVRDITKRKLYEQDLKRSEEKFKIIYSDSPIGIELYDRKGKLVDLNKSCLDMFGVSSIDAVKDFDLFDDPNIPPDQLSKLRKGESVKFESDFDFDLVKSLNLYETTKTGKFYVNVLITPLHLEGTESISNYLVQVQDITDNKIVEQKLKDINEELGRKYKLKTTDLRQSEEKFKLLYENAPLSYQSLDYAGKILEVNKAWLDFFGYTKDEVIGKWFGDFIDPEYLRVLNVKFPKFKEEGEIKAIEYEMIKKDGSHAIVEFDGKISYDDQGYFKQTHCIFRDITEQKKSEQMLKESEAKYRSIIDNSGSSIVVLDKEGFYEIVNKQAAESLGGKPEDFIQKSLFDIFSRDIAEEYLKNNKKIIESGIGRQYERTFDLPNGTRTFVINEQAINDSKGRGIYITSSSVDITARKLEEQRSKESEEKFRMLFNNVNDAIVIVDTEGKVIECNQTSYERLGYTKEEFLNMSPMDIDTPEYAEGVLDRIEVVLQEGASSYEVDHVRKDGKITPVEINSTKINFQGKTAVLSVVRDITERKKGEKKLRDSEAKYRSIIDNSASNIVVLDKNGYYEIINKQAVETFGREPEDFVKKSIFDLFSKDFAERYFNYNKEIIESGIGRQYERTFDLPSGTRTLLINDQVIKDSEERGKYIVSSSVDITERKLFEQRLKESEEKFRNIAEQSLMGIFIIQDDVIKYANKRMTEINGYSLEEMLNWQPKEHYITLSPESLAFVEEQARIQKLGDSDLSSQYPLQIVRKAGEKIWVENFSKIITFEGRPANFITFFDISERRKLDQKLKYHLELEQLVSRISVEFINIQGEKFDERINSVLKEVAQFSNAVRGSVFLLSEDLTRVTNTHEWCANSNDSQIHLLQNIPFETFGYYKKILERHQPVVIGHLKDIPSEAKGELDWIKEHGFRPLLFVPMIHQGVLYGALGIYRGIDEKREWVEPFITMLRFLGNNLVNTIERIKSEQNLKDSQEKFATAFHSNPNISAIIRMKDGEIIDVNEALLQTLGYTRNELIGKKMSEFGLWVYPEERKKYLDALEKDQEAKEFDVSVRTKSGQILNTLFSGSIINLNDEPHLITTAIDVTEKRRAERMLKESEDKYHLLFNNSPIGIGLSTIEGHVIEFNEAMRELTGYTKEELNRLGIPTIYSDHNERAKAVKILRESGILRDHELKFKRKDGTEFYGSLSLDFTEINGVEIIQSTLKDITDKKEVELELIKLNNLKSELLRRTSHELKTPLVSIKGFSDLLLEVHRDKLDYYVVSTIDEIKQGCLRLEALISDILKTAELESGVIKLQKSREDISFLIRLCVNEVRGFSDSRNHSLELEIPEHLELNFEKEQIHQVINNLINNAIKYTPKNGLIKIKSQIQNENVLISVKDNGIGLSLNDKNQLFKQFGKIERFGQGLDVIPDGSGLGLYISKKIIELHGGEIWVESEGKNRGSTFYFTLPLH